MYHPTDPDELKQARVQLGKWRAAWHNAVARKRVAAALTASGEIEFWTNKVAALEAARKEGHP